MSQSTFLNLLLGTSLVALVACGGCNDHAHSVEAKATGATCPQGSSLTYTSFGKAFMEKYCVSCHAASKTGAARNGAPEFHDFDTLLGIKQVADHVDLYAGAGPSATNELMPEGDPAPTLAERKQLSEWIACGLPR